jgi:hypothetical protein
MQYPGRATYGLSPGNDIKTSLAGFVTKNQLGRVRGAMWPV